VAPAPPPLAPSVPEARCSAVQLFYILAHHTYITRERADAGPGVQRATSPR
jgi:hypothetical protein